MQIADVFRFRFGKLGLGRRALVEIFPAFARAALAIGGGLGHVRNLARINQDFGIGTLQLNGKLVDIAFLAAEGGRQRQRNRPCPHQGTGAEKRREFRAGFRDDCDAVFLFDAHRNQAVCPLDRILAHLHIGVTAFQRATHVMEVETLRTPRSVVDGFVEGREIRTATRQVAIVRRRRNFGVGHNFRRYP